MKTVAESSATEAVKRLVAHLKTAEEFLGAVDGLHRALLEQSFLRVFLPQDHDTPSGNQMTSSHTLREASKVFYTTALDALPASVQADLVRDLSTVLIASSYSFFLALDFLFRQKKASVAIECFALWWYCNPDQVPVEVPSGHRLLPYSPAYMGGHLNRGITEQLSEYTKAFEASASKEQIHQRKEYNGFLCPQAVFPPHFTEHLRAHLHQFTGPHYVSSSILLRMLEELLTVYWENQGDDSSSLASRGVELLRQLILEWLIPVTAQVEGKTDGVQPMDWLFCAACISAATYFEYHHRECCSLWRAVGHRQDFLSPISPLTAFDSHREVYLTHLLSLFPSERLGRGEEVILARCDEGFSSTLLAMVDGGFFQSVHSASSAWLCECWHRRLFTQFPRVFTADSLLTTIWTLHMLEQIAASRPGRGPSLQFAGQENALLQWQRHAAGQTGTLHTSMSSDHFRRISEPHLIPRTVSAVAQRADGFSPLELLQEVRRFVSRIMTRYVELFLHAEDHRGGTPQCTAALPSTYVFLRFLHLICKLGRLDDSSDFSTLEDDVVLQCIRCEVMPRANGGLSSYLQRLQALYLSHSGRDGALALLTLPYRNLLDNFSSSGYWQVLLTALLWSGLPSTESTRELLVHGIPLIHGELGGRSDGSHDGRAASNRTGSFGCESLSWEGLRCLTAETSLDLGYHDAALRGALNHLLLLATAIPEEAVHFASIELVSSLAETGRLSAELEEDEEPLSADDLTAKSQEMSELAAVVDEDLELANQLADVEYTDTFMEEEEKSHDKVKKPLKETMQNAERNHAAKVRDDEPHRDSPSLVIKALHHIPSCCQKTYLSLLELFEYWTHVNGYDQARFKVLLLWSSKILHSRGNALNVSGVSQALSSRSVVTVVLQITVASCSDILLLATGVVLLQLKASKSSSDAAHTPYRPFFGPPELPWHLTCSLCRLFYHSGIQKRNVETWLKATLCSQTSTHSSLDRHSYQPLLDLFLSASSESGVCFSQLSSQQLLYTTAAITLFALKRRFQKPSRRPLPFYVASFLQNDTTRAAPVILPSLQLYSRHSSKPRLDTRQVDRQTVAAVGQSCRLVRPSSRVSPITDSAVATFCD